MKQIQTISQMRKYLKSKIKIDDGKRAKGRLRLKAFSLEKQFNSPTLTREQLDHYVDEVAPSFLATINTPLKKGETKFTTPLNAEQRGNVMQKLEGPIHQDVLAAFYEEAKTFGEVFMTRCPPTMKKVNGVPKLKNHKATHQFKMLNIWNAPIDSIDKDDIIEALKALQVARKYNSWGQLVGATITKSTAAGLHRNLQTIFAHAARTAMIPFDPITRFELEMKKVLWKQDPRGKNHYLTFAQCDFLELAAAQLDKKWSTSNVGGWDDSFAEMLLFFKLGVHAGARFDDLCDLRWDEISDLGTDEATYSFIQRKFKGTEEPYWNGNPEAYRVNISLDHDPELLRMIRAKHLRDNNDNVYFFSSRDGSKINPDGSIRPRFAEMVILANKMIRASTVNVKTSKKEGREKVREIKASPHMMRHTCAAQVVTMTNGNWELAAKRLGHSSSKITRLVYGDMLSEWIEDEMSEAARLMTVAREKARARVKAATK